MPSIQESQYPAGKLLLLGGVIVVAVGLFAYFWIASRQSSGTVDAEVRQMRPGIRSRH